VENQSAADRQAPLQARPACHGARKPGRDVSRLGRSPGLRCCRRTLVRGMRSMRLRINGRFHTIDGPDDMPLLWVLRDVIGMTGTKFGCGMAACGACTVHIDGQATRSCVTPVSILAGREITTIEAIGETAAGKKIQDAWIAREVPQCGYCQSGQIM